MTKTRQKRPKKPTLAEKTLEMLTTRSRVITCEQIAKSIGCSTSWLYSFQSGEIPDPSVNTIQALYDFLNPESPLQY